MKKQVKAEMYSQEIITIAENSRFLGAVVLTAVYLIKGVVMFIPVQLLYLTGGAVFGLWWGTVINTIGVAVCLTAGYCSGKYFRTDRLTEFMAKYPALAAVDKFQTENAFFFSYIVRIIGILPCDIVSLYCGIKGIAYRQYITGAVLGMMPGIVLTGILGANIRTPHSPRFIISLCLHVFTLILSTVLYNKIIKRHKEK